MDAASSSEPSISLLPPKRQKRTNYSKCVICQLETTDTLRKAKSTSIDTFVTALKLRLDEVYDRLEIDLTRLSEKDVFWHHSCYSSFTSQHNLKYAKTGKLSVSPTPSEESIIGNTSFPDSNASNRASRSQTVPTDWSKCLFCKCKTHKKVKAMINASTYQVCRSIRDAAVVQDDGNMLSILDNINNDLIAAEAKYHKACFSSYVSKSNLKFTSYNEVKEEDLYSSAFEQLVKEIATELKSERAFDMSTLLAKYRSFLEQKGVATQAYSSQKLKLRLTKYFGNEIVFHQPCDRSLSELVYSSSISLQGVINAAYQNSSRPASSTSKKPVDPTDNSPDDRTRLLYRTAKLIKSDIGNCTGISVKPPNSRDLSLMTCRSVIPDSLYCLLRWIIASPEQEDLDEELLTTQCSNMADERRILMLAQDIVYCASHSQTKMPKHVSMAIALRHLTGSKQLVTMLNRMGHCCSYDEVEVMDTSLAREMLAKSELFGVVIPSNIVPGVFVQAAGDNNDINEETLDGKSTTHATTLVLYQQGQFGPAPRSNVYADHSKRLKALDKTGLQQTLLEFSAFGKRPCTTNFIGKMSQEWFSCSDDQQSTSSLDLAWAMARLCPTKLFEVSLEPLPADQQKVPGWSGFNAMVHQQVPVETNVGYCPMIDGSPTYFSTIYTVMKNVQSMMSTLGQKDSVVTFDLAIYMKAKEIQWRQPDEFKDMVIRMGGFHIVLNYLALLGKKYEGSGFEDLLIEAGVYGSGTVTSIMRGKSYNRGVRAHKMVMEALFRLQWQEYVRWQNARDISIINQQNVVEAAQSLQNAMGDSQKTSDVLEYLKGSIETVQNEFLKYQKEMESKSQIFKFWNDYMHMVQLLLKFIRAERTGNWQLHLSTTAAMTPHFFSMDRPNYSRWLPVYVADMNTLSEAHPDVYREFVDGNHTISRSGQPFSKVSTDMALEQSINRDSKTTGGIIGVTTKPGALARWFLTSHERAAITTTLKEMCGLQGGGDGDTIGHHKEAAPSRIHRDEEDVQKLQLAFSSGTITNPFKLDDEDDGSNRLVNLATGLLMPPDDASRILQSYTLGISQMSEFVEARLNTNDVSFWDPIRKLKIKTFANMSKQKKIKATNEKVITISADRDLLNRLVIAAKARDVNLKDVLSYELSTVPFSLAYADGTLRKTNKSVLLGELEEKADVQSKLPIPSPDMTTAYVIDGMAVVQMVKAGGASTFGELASTHYKMLTSSLGKNGCHRVDVVFDRYLPRSIKSGERSKRGESAALEVKIHGPQTPIPKQWQKYITNPENKKQLCGFLVKTWAQMGQEQLLEGQQLVIGGGHKDDCNKAVLISREQQSIIPALASDQEEADTRLVLHAKHASLDHQRIVVQSPDTDVLVLCVTHYQNLNCKELWFRTGVKDKLRYIAVHSIANELGEKLCYSLPGFHSVTGCDSTSSLARIGKKKAFKILLDNEEYQDTLGILGDTLPLTDRLAEMCEQYISHLYTTAQKAGTTVNGVRYWMFCQKQRRSDGLPPSYDSLVQHLKRANFQAHIWKKALVAMHSLPSPDQHGWEIENDSLQPVLMTNDPAPSGLLELSRCGCQTCSRADCSCKVNDLGCTEGCQCMGQEDCLNPFSAIHNPESDDED